MTVSTPGGRPASIRPGRWRSTSPAHPRPAAPPPAAGGERRGDLARGKEGGKIPRREREADPDRLIDHRQALVGGAARNGLAVDPLGLLAKPFDWSAAALVSPRASRSGLPVSALMTRGDRLEAFADQLGRPPHDLRPVPGRQLSPGLKAARRARQHRRDVFRRGPGTSPICSSVAGEKTAMVFPETARRQCYR